MFGVCMGSTQRRPDGVWYLYINDATEGALNGESAGIQIAPPFAYELPGRAGENTLVIEVATAPERQCYPLPDSYRKMPHYVIK